jgi:hypothetical protein
MLVLAPFHPVPETGCAPSPVQADLANLDETMAALKPRLRLDVPKDLCPAGALELEFTAMRHLRPRRLHEASAYLHAVHDALEHVRTARREGRSAAQIAEEIGAQWPGLPLDFSVSEDDAPQAGGDSAVDDILAMVATPAAQSPSGSGPKAWAGQLEDLMGRLLAAVYGHESFRALEAAWRGLETILKQGPVKEGPPAEGGWVQVQIAAVSRAALPESLERLAADLAEDPPHLVLLDCGLDNTPASVELANRIADFADAMLSPTAFWLTPRFLHLENFAGLGKLQYLPHHLEDAAYAKWSKLKQHPGGSRLAAMLNRFAIRPPYGHDNDPKTPMFAETEPLWLAPVYALGALAAQSAVARGWPTRFTDYREHQVTDLACADFAGQGPLAVETPLDEGRIAECIEAGLTPLVGALKKNLAILPRETALDGSSLKFHLFFSRLAGFLLGLKAQLPPDADPAPSVREALSLYFQQTCRETPPDLEVTAGEAQDGMLPLRIALTPPRSILQAERLEFDFGW